MIFKSAAMLAASLLAIPAALAHAGQIPPQPGDIVPEPDVSTLMGTDLTISSVSGPRCPDAGQPIGSDLEVEIENLGLDSVGHDFSIRFDIFHVGQSLGPIPLTQARQSVDGIGAQTSKIVGLTHSLAIPANLPYGPAELIIEVDSGDNVEETDESNNTSRFTILIGGSGGSCLQ